MNNWIIFENEVAELLISLGYQIERDILIAGQQIDILGTFEVPGGIPIRIIFECKYRSNAPIGNQDIYDFATVFRAIREVEKINEAILVSNITFTRFAKDAGKAIGITLLTYNEILIKVANFKPYLQLFIQEYESTPIFSTYINLNCCTANQMKKIESITDDNKRKKEILKYEMNVDEVIFNWLNSESKLQFLLLGDYGTGKTTVCKQLLYILAQQYLDDCESNRIPLLITLREYSKGSGARQLITDFLVNKCSININYETFRRLNKLGKFVIVFDGFDEMSTSVNASVTIEAIQNISELIEDSSKVIITGRPGYFPTQSDLEQGFKEKQPIDPYERAHIESAEQKHTFYKHHYLLPLDRPKIIEMLNKRRNDLLSIGNGNIEEVITIIDNTYNLADLAERPVLLDIIIKTLPSLSNELERINTYKLYHIYTDYWIDREESKGRKLINKKSKMLFMEELSIQMFNQDQLSIHYLEISPSIKKYFKIDEGDKLDYFDHDIRTCSFLNRDSNGYYYFAHKSFMEFFVSVKINLEILLKENWHFGRKLLTKEICKFINESISSDHKETLLTWFLRAGSSSHSGGQYSAENALNILQMSEQNFANLDFIKKSYVGLNFQGLNLSKSDFTESNLSRCDFERSTLEGTLFEDTNLSKAIFKSANLRFANLRNANLTSANFEDCFLENAKMEKSNLTNVIGWTKVNSFKGTQLTDAIGLKYEEIDYCKMRGASGEPIESDEEKKRRKQEAKMKSRQDRYEKIQEKFYKRFNKKNKGDSNNIVDP